MVFDKITNCFDLCLACLEADASPDTFLKQRLLQRRDQVELFLLEEEERFDGSMLRDWLIQGYLRLFDLFLYGWLSNIYLRDKECKDTLMKELMSVVDKCDPTKIDSETIVELASALTLCQNAVNEAFKRLEDNTIN